MEHMIEKNTKHDSLSCMQQVQMICLEVWMAFDYIFKTHFMMATRGLETGKDDSGSGNRIIREFLKWHEEDLFWGFVF